MAHVRAKPRGHPIACHREGGTVLWKLVGIVSEAPDEPGQVGDYEKAIRDMAGKGLMNNIFLQPCSSRLKMCLIGVTILTP